MTNQEKNKCIYEIFGWCWHEVDENWFLIVTCKHCGSNFSANLDFFTSNEVQQAINFFKLWNTVKKENYFIDFLAWGHERLGIQCWVDLINCSTLADAIIEYHEIKETPNEP